MSKMMRTLWLVLLMTPLALSAETEMPNPAVAVEVPAAPEEGGPRNWRVAASDILNLREGPATKADIVTRLPSGTLLDNLGCRRAEGRAWCDVQPLGGGPRGFVAADFLVPAISPDGTAATGPDDSALRAGREDYDATGSLSCSQASGQPMTRCDFGIARSGGGYATVIIDKPDGRIRSVYFRMGRAIGAGTSEADPSEFRAERIDDLSIIHVGDERYEIPDAVVLGG